MVPTLAGLVPVTEVLRLAASTATTPRARIDSVLMGCTAMLVVSNFSMMASGCRQTYALSLVPQQAAVGWGLIGGAIKRSLRNTLAMARSRLLSADERRALVVLANSPDGATTALLLGYGFMQETTTTLVRAGLVTMTPDEVVRADGRVMDVSLVKITKTGRRVVATVDLPMSLYRWNTTAPPRRPGGSA